MNKVTIEYLAKELGVTIACAGRMASRAAQPVGKAGKMGNQNLYDQVNLDKIIANYRGDRARNPDEWTIKDVAQYFGCSVSMINRLIEKGVFPREKMRKNSKFQPKPVRFWLATDIRSLDFDHICELKKKSNYNPFIYSGKSAEIILFLQPKLGYRKIDGVK